TPPLARSSGGVPRHQNKKCELTICEVDRPFPITNSVDLHLLSVMGDGIRGGDPTLKGRSKFRPRENAERSDGVHSFCIDRKRASARFLPGVQSGNGFLQSPVRALRPLVLDGGTRLRDPLSGAGADG